MAALFLAVAFVAIPGIIVIFVLMIDAAFRNTLVLVLMTILVIVAVIALFILIHIVVRLRRDNVFLLRQVDSILGNNHTRDMQNMMEEAGERLKVHRQLAEMTDAQLQVYVEDSFRQKKFHTNPNLTMKEAAMNLGITQERLKTLFGAGRPLGFFSDFVANLRLFEACQLLKSKNNYTIEAVAKDAGFSSRKTFQTRFKDKFGMTPSQYRLSKSSPHE